MEEKTNTLAQQPTTCEDLEQKMEILKKESAALKKSLATLQEKGKIFANQKMEIEKTLIRWFP